MAVMSAASGRGIDFMLGAVSPVLPFNRLLVWHKAFVNSAVAGPWRWDIVPVLWFGSASFGRPVAGSSVYHSDGHTRRPKGHPSPLPVGLGRWLMQGFPDGLTVRARFSQPRSPSAASPSASRSTNAGAKCQPHAASRPPSIGPTRTFSKRERSHDDAVEKRPRDRRPDRP